MPPLMIGFTLALLCALLLTHVVRGWGLRAGWVDRPDGHRRAHAGAVPRVGGIAIYITVLLVLAGGVYVRAVDLDALEPGYVPAFLIGGAAIFLMGLWDDTRGLPARTKFLFEIAVALAVFWAGIRVVGFGLPSGGSVYFPFWFSILTTVIWIVGITNAFNLIDGTDGLAAGAALFASTSLGLVSLISQNALGAAVALVLTGATLGFLFYNFPPASIYLGDSGSLFLGFTLAVLGLVTTQTSPTALAVAIPVVSFGLPILDTVLAIARRFLRGERMFSPDRGHIHHRLLDLGHSPRQVALMLYAACAGFALLSILLISPAEPTVAAIFIVSGAIVWLAVQRLHIPELLELGRVLHRGRYQRLAIASNVRIREAVRRLEVAHDGEAVVSAATHAFEEGEFARAELWLEKNRAKALHGCTAVTEQPEGYLWSWHSAAVEPPDAWEMKLQFRDERGRPVGRLSLWRPIEEGCLLADVRLLAVEFQAAVEHALARLNEVPAGSPLSPTGELAPDAPPARDARPWVGERPGSVSGHAASKPRVVVS